MRQEYHYATQCIPTPLAWFAHQLHPLVQRFSVAATLVIEIPATALLLSPILSHRRVGAGLQVLLQFLIILTGNYNFFNVRGGLYLSLTPPRPWIACVHKLRPYTSTD